MKGNIIVNHTPVNRIISCSRSVYRAARVMVTCTHSYRIAGDKELE